MKVLYVTKPGSKIHVHRGTVYLKCNGEEIVITPDYNQLIIASSGIGITSKAIRKLAYMGIDVVFLDPYGTPIARIYPPFINKTVNTRVMQYKFIVVEGRGLEIAKEIIYCKLYNQASLLKYFAKIYREPVYRDIGYEVEAIADELYSIPFNELSEEKIMAYESYGARQYWGVVSSILPDNLGFNGRDPDSSDPFNMALNYGYGILYGIVEKSLLLAGLDPYLGFLHTLKSGKPSLTLDFIEMFRQACVDKPLIINAKNIDFELIAGKLSYETRRAIAKYVLDQLDKKHYYYKVSKKIELSKIILSEAWDLAKALRMKTMYRGFKVMY